MTPASMKAMTIDGPDVVIASPMITKMPVPMMAPRPERGQVERADGAAQLGSFSWVSSTSRSIGLVANIPLRRVRSWIPSRAA